MYKFEKFHRLFFISFPSSYFDSMKVMKRELWVSKAKYSSGPAAIILTGI